MVSYKYKKKGDLVMKVYINWETQEIVGPNQVEETADFSTIWRTINFLKNILKNIIVSPKFGVWMINRKRVLWKTTLIIRENM